MQLNNKRILFIGTGFYRYDDAILKQMEVCGAKVSYFSSIRTITYFEKILLLRSKSKIQKVKEKYVTNLIETAPDEVDIVFCIKGENLNDNHIKQLRNKYPNARTILYLWDSIVRLLNWELLHSYFKNIYTFDRLDSIKYGLSFRPLFYIQAKEDVLQSTDNKYDYDFSFVGEFHTDRYEILRKIKQEVLAHNNSYCIQLYIDRYGYFLNRFILKRIKPEDKDLLIFRKMSYQKYLNITNKSRAIIDIENPRQSGLTIRSIETLAMGKYLVTTNSDIYNYEDIDASTYCIINRENPTMPSVPYQERPKGLSDNYSIEAFVNEMFR